MRTGPQARTARSAPRAAADEVSATVRGRTVGPERATARRAEGA